MRESTPEEAKLEQSVLQYVGRKGYQPVKPRVIAKKLGLNKEETTDLKSAIKRLVRRGQIAYGTNHLVRPVVASDAPSPSQENAAAAVAEPSSKDASADGMRKRTTATPSAKDAKKQSKNKNVVVGLFRRHERGFGFVRPANAEGDAADVYIPARRAGSAATGDLVEVQLVGQRGRDKTPGPKGEIVDILQRQTHQFVGTYFEAEGVGQVLVDGQVFAQPITVGDPGAKGAREDDKVVLEMVRFPSPYSSGEGVITEVLGPAGTPEVDTLSVIRQFELPEAFAEDALEQARQEADEFEESMPADRQDFTGQTILTIDPADARDFDDAISLERDERGHWHLGVHIADVAHFVPEGTPLDREARNRATSVYLPDRVIPMLPEIISNSLASLQPGKIRYTKTAVIEFSSEGQPIAGTFHRSVIRSAKRLNYDEVDQFLADRESWRDKLSPEVHALLGRMHELAMLLRKRRFARGALDISMPEVKIDLDADGHVSGAHAVSYTESHQIIEEFMLAANEAVAQALADRDIAFLRRIHADPTPLKLKSLAEFVNALGLKSGSLESRFELQSLLDRVLGRREAHAVHFAVLRSMQQAVYGPREEGHYALASRCYCHFTSPIRRYPDLTVHRLLDEVLLGRAPTSHFDELVVLGEHCSQREQRAERAERELVKLKLLNYFSSRIGEEMDAVVTGVQRYGLFVQGLEIPAEGLIHVDSLADDNYYYDRDTHTLSGYRRGNLFRLGDPLRVAVARVDLQRRELDFRLIGKREQTSP